MFVCVIQDEMTPQEARVFLTCKSDAVKNFTLGSLVGAGVTWAGMRFCSPPAW